MVFKSEVVRAQWDNWCYEYQGTFYLYYLITEHSGGEGFGVATSTDGVHWKDLGWCIAASTEMVEFLGTGSVWKAADFETSGTFLCNYSEWRKDPETGRSRQTILFASSKDLIHWTKFPDELQFPIAETLYDKWGRWDCIYPLPRAADGSEKEGYWGTWTATSLPDSPHQGTVGLGYSDDGLHWTALPAPEVTPGVFESGAFRRFNEGKLHAMFGLDGNMWSYVADDVPGPYRRTETNARLLAAGQTYFSRFFPQPDGEVLVNHQSNSDWGWHIAPLKRAVVDSKGTLRLEYWLGNDALKGERLPLKADDGTRAVTLVSQPLDWLKGLAFEGQLKLPTTPSDPPAGFYLLPEGRGGHAIKVYGDGKTEFGTMDPFGGSWQPVLTVDREYDFGLVTGFRLLTRRGMVELYLDDQLIECYHLRGAGGSEKLRLGLLGPPETLPAAKLKAWQMTLKGKPVALASSLYSPDYEAWRAFDGDVTTRWSSGQPYGKPEWVQVDLGVPQPINTVLITWEAWAKSYELLVSDDGKDWRSLYSTTSGKGDEERLEQLEGYGRYLRLNCLERGTDNGYSVFELRVLD